MSAVVRVKRRIDEEPLSAFIINCKKPKLDPTTPNSSLASKDEVSTIVKFAATLESQDEEATLQIAKLTKDEAKELASKVRKYPDTLNRNRQQMHERSQENRFKVVNCYRAVESGETEENATKEVTIVDVERQAWQIAANGNQETTHAQLNSADAQSIPSDTTPSVVSNAPDRDHSNNYVYDVYLADETDQDYVNLDDNSFSVRPIDDLVYEYNNYDYYDECDSDDSNQENYFKNDYPDTDEEQDDDDSSIGIRDMQRAMETVDLDGDYELSSDGEDNGNGFIYSIDSEAIGFEDDIDYCDVNRYGETYARYSGRSRRNREATYNDNESDYSDHYNSDDEE